MRLGGMEAVPELTLAAYVLKRCAGSPAATYRVLPGRSTWPNNRKRTQMPRQPQDAP